MVYIREELYGIYERGVVWYILERSCVVYMREELCGIYKRGVMWYI